MDLPFTVDRFFEMFASYNRSLWPFVLALWVYGAAAVPVLARRHRNRGRLIAGMLAIQWAWAGIIYHAAFFTAINPAAWIFAALFVLEGVLLVWFGVVRDQLRFSPTGSRRHVASWLLIIYALLYPIVVQAEGHSFPEGPTFGLPCPTTLLTVGLLLAADPPWPRAVALIPIIWAAIAGSAAVVLGVRADLMLWVAAGGLTASMVAPVRLSVRA